MNSPQQQTQPLTTTTSPSTLLLQTHHHYNQPYNPNNLRTSSFNKSFTQQIVQNVCCQIKYIIQGNLQEQNIQQIVRDYIIPALIRIFFTPQQQQKSNGFRWLHQQNIKTMTKDIACSTAAENYWNCTENNRQKPVMNSSLTQQMSFSTNEIPIRKCFNDILNIDGGSSSNHHQSLHKKSSPQKFIHKIINQKENDQNGINNKENDKQKILSQKIEKINKRSIFLMIVLLKLFLKSKLSVFQLILSQPQKKKITFETFFKLHSNQLNNSLRNVFKKFKQNQTFLRIQAINIKHKEQKRQMFIKAFIRIVKNGILSNFLHFKNNSLSKNQFLKEWVQRAALNSPLTLQNSIWRIKKFTHCQSKKINNSAKYQHEENLVLLVNKLTKIIKLISFKELLIGYCVKSQRKQEQTVSSATNKQPNKQFNEKSDRNSIKIIQQPVPQQFEKQHQISSEQFDSMFNNEQDDDEEEIQQQQQLTPHQQYKSSQQTQENNKQYQHNDQQQSSRTKIQDPFSNDVLPTIQEQDITSQGVVEYQSQKDFVKQ